MKAHSRSLLLLALGLISACGRSTPLDPSDRLPAEKQPSAVQPLCAALGVDPKRVVLASVSGEYGCVQELTFIHADGSLTLAGAFGEQRRRPTACIYISNVSVSADGDFILAQRLTDGAALFDRSGALVVRVNDNVAMRAELIKRALWGLVDVVDGYGVVGKPSRGRIPVQRFTDQEGWFRGWMNPADHTVTAIGPPLPKDVELSWIDGAFAGVVKVNGRALWTRFFPDEVLTTPLPDYRGEQYMHLMDRRDRWSRVGSFTDDRWWRVQDGTGAVELLQQAAPAGMTQLKDGASAASPRLYLDLDDDGGFLDVFRDAAGAGLFHSPDGAHDWTRIGREVTQVGGVYGWSRSGTYVVRGAKFGNTPQSWSTAGVSALVGPSTQLLRPASGVALVLAENTGVLLSQRGVCAASFAESGPVAPPSVVDMETGVVRTVEGLSASGLVWLE